MRVVSTLFLAACGFGTDDVLVGEGPDATARDGGFSADVFLPPLADVAPPEPVFQGGPLACGSCTCDGTLYACLEGASPEGGCSGGGPHVPFAGDAGDDAEVDAGKSCGIARFCTQLPVECLPKPTCACITKTLGFACTIDPMGNGFTLQCPPPTP